MTLSPPDLWSSLVTRLRDRARSGAVALELSGDVASSVAAVVACDALGPANVTGLFFGDDVDPQVRDLALHTGLDFRQESVQPLVDVFLARLTLDPQVAADLTARVRRVVLLALAEQEGRLVLDQEIPDGEVSALARWRNQQAVAQGKPAPISEM
ncbi:hypothetical protein Dvina_44940 [Dactylosporangium vinaceum]|uniref:NAD/GMP synthase domain-containing protein n=1 Tax=Dactylosporangium vinaceum TaxID=53362 RepID=A0ABV5MNJ3_9ACTN|nr:hypothetical protein [Dactylosporangium vinaceum]UAB95124.1 hypothetical protein Dvina_44940 [Dactylosporangium vinaceum]